MCLNVCRCKMCVQNMLATYTCMSVHMTLISTCMYIVQGGREGEREGGREGEREGGRREGGREGGRREGGREGGREREREGERLHTTLTSPLLKESSF